MTTKLFISYSHKDEEYKKELEENLAMLKRKGLISVWHDRKITVGDDWKNAIDENLEQSDIIVFLISPSFLASDYCYDVEVRRAIELNNSGKSRIISIILRPCDWNDCEFSRFQATPKDAKPITTWDNKDSAWLDVISQIKAAIKQLQLPSNPPIVKEDSKAEINSAFMDWLDDTEIVLTHRKVDKVKLSMVYVASDMQYEEYNSKESKIASTNQLVNKEGLYLVYGEEQQGKTTFLKSSYVELLRKKFIPVYIDSKIIKTADLDKVVLKAISEQYSNLVYDQSINSKIVLLIDNFDGITLNEKHIKIFIDHILNNFKWVIITCHNSFNYVSSEFPSLDRFSQKKLLGFGNLKREEIVKRWVSLGVEESIQDKELYTKCDEIKEHLNTVIKRNVVPAKPIYILMIIQMFEAYKQQNLELTSYGHCYQQLIYQSLEKAKITTKEYEKYLNVLTEFSWARFKLGRGLNSFQLDQFFLSYGNVFLEVDSKEVINKLLSCSILNSIDYLTDFKYPYIYYFFVAKKIAEGYAESDDIKREVEGLFDRIYREDAANILIFITHHTKDNWVLNKIGEVLSGLFKEQKIATLAKDQLSFMDDFIKKIPNLVLEQREVNKAREEQNRRLDEIENKDDAEEIEAVGENVELDILVKINKTFKGMEIAGQIIRNRHASMMKSAIYDLASSGASSGLRFLDYFISISNEFKAEIILFIESKLKEHPSLTNREIQDIAENTYIQHTYMIIYSVIRKISSSIGSNEAKVIYAELEGKENTPSYSLINLAIELQFTRSLNIESIEKVKEKLENNAVCFRILKEIVIQHTYMFPVEYKVKQKLAEILKISVQNQRIMDQKKEVKGL